MTSPAHRPLTDSPWFWIHAFAAAALAAVLLLGPRVHDRQVQIERNGQGRQRALLDNPADQAKIRVSTAEHTVISIQPLTAVLVCVFLASGVVLWVKRAARARTKQPPSTASDATGVNP